MGMLLQLFNIYLKLVYFYLVVGSIRIRIRNKLLCGSDPQHHNKAVDDAIQGPK
jgi:hypothetical protein